MTNGTTSRGDAEGAYPAPGRQIPALRIRVFFVARIVGNLDGPRRVRTEAACAGLVGRGSRFSDPCLPAIVAIRSPHQQELPVP